MSKFVDLVDKNGHVQKYAVPRNESRDHDDLYMQIAIVVVFDGLGQVLVQKRATEPNIGAIDHICGAVDTGESPDQAAVREAAEETGITPCNIRLVTQGINEYGRYRYLFVGGATEGEPAGDPREVQWVGYLHPDELHAGHASGELTFVDGFFEDIELCSPR